MDSRAVFDLEGLVARCGLDRYGRGPVPRRCVDFGLKPSGRAHALGFHHLEFHGRDDVHVAFGVKKEMKFAVPAMIASAALGVVIRIVSLFLT